MSGSPLADESERVRLSKEEEAFAARFARLADIQIKKVFRAIDALELVDEGSILDRLSRMEKRRIIVSASDWRKVKEIRNQIAHDYVAEDLSSLYNDAYAMAPELLDALNRTKAYLG